MRPGHNLRTTAGTNDDLVLTPICFWRTGTEPEATGAWPESAIGSGTIVGEKENEGVVELAGFPKYLEHAPHSTVNVGDLGCVDRHALGLPVLVLVLLPVRDVSGIRRGLGPIRQETHLALSLDPGGSPIVPAFGTVALAERGDGFLAGVQGPVRRHVADVEEERLFIGDGFLEKANGMVVESIGHEKIVGEFPRLVVEVEIVLHNGMPITDHASAIGPEETVEPALHREVATLPLANHGGVVPAGLQQLGDEYAFRKILGHVPVVTSMSGLLAVQAGQQRGPGGAADGIVVKTREAQTTLSQRVDVGRVDLAAVATEIGPTHVVDHDQQDIGPPLAMQKSRHGQQKQNKGKTESSHGVCFVDCLNYFANLLFTAFDGALPS